MDDKKLSEAWLKLKGNPSVKRALMVAWAGKHSIVVVGNPDNGKLYLDRIAVGLGINYSFLNPCLCGDLYEPLTLCHWAKRTIMSLRNRGSFRQALNGDVSIRLERPLKRDLDAQETPLHLDMQWAKPNGEPDMAKELPVAPDAKALMAMVYERFSLTLGAYERTLQVAKTIALMNGMDEIMGCHMAEALQYRVEPLFRS